MARMLDLFKQGLERHTQLVLATDGCDGDLPGHGEDDGEPPVSFIEVGGRGEPVDASPDVLAAGPLPVRLHQAPRPETNGPPVVTLPLRPAGRSPALEFRPLPAEPLALAPAPGCFAPELVAYHRPQDPASEQYRNVLSALTAALPASRPQVLLFSAAEPGTGTTTVLLNLAITLARESPLRVVVVDAHFARPALAERLGLRTVPGLANTLAGSVTVAQALQETGLEHLRALTVGRARRTNAVPAESCAVVLQQLRERFDRVLVDAGCWDGRPETLALASASDAVYLVLRKGEEEAEGVEELLEVIPQQGGRLSGCLLVQR